MPQISVWSPTRSLAKKVAVRRTGQENRPVKVNEIVHEALKAYAKASAAMTDAEIEEALQVAVAKKKA